MLAQQYSKEGCKENNKAAMQMLRLTYAQSIIDRRKESINYVAVCLLACSFSKPKMNLALTDHHVSKIYLIGRDTCAHFENAYQPFLISCSKRGQPVEACLETAGKI